MQCLFCNLILNHREMSGLACFNCIAIDGKSACIYSERRGWMIVIDKFYLNIRFDNNDMSLFSYNNGWQQICSIDGIMLPKEITLENVKKKIDLMKSFA